MKGLEQLSGCVLLVYSTVWGFPSFYVLGMQQEITGISPMLKDFPLSAALIRRFLN